jgi:hypothetical protein
MPEISKRVLIVTLPESAQELAPHFAALASENGAERHFIATEEESGENCLVIFRTDGAAPPLTMKQQVTKTLQCVERIEKRLAQRAAEKREI